MKRSLIACLIVSIAIQVPFLFAADDTPAPHPLMAFADHLFTQGDYYRAITEYERLAFTYPAQTLAAHARYQIGMCYMAGQRWDQAITAFERAHKQSADKRTAQMSGLMIAETHYRRGAFSAALSALETLRQSPLDSDLADLCRLIEGKCYLRFGNIGYAQNTFQKVAASNASLRTVAEQLGRDSALLSDVPTKSPRLAAALSAILPGAGQLYTERTGDAMVAFIVNGVLIFGVIEAFHHDEDVTGTALACLEGLWYGGTIYNAANNAHKYNRDQKNRFFDNLQVRFGAIVEKDESWRRGSDWSPAVMAGFRF